MENKDWLDIVVLEDYLDGKLDAKSMNRVERAALEDPFVAEALAGLSMSPQRSLASLSLLQKQLHERISGQQQAKKTAVVTWQRLSIAATAAVLFISVGIIFWMKQVNYQQMVASQPKKMDILIAPKDSSEEQAAPVPETIPPVISNDVASAKARVRPSGGIAAPSVVAAQQAVPVSASAALGQKLEDSNQLAARVPGTNSVDVGGPVIRGYQKKTGDTTTQRNSIIVSGKEVQDAPVSNIKELLQGKVAGLNIVNKATPIGGWAKYKEYLIRENRYSAEAKPGQVFEYKFIIKDGKPDKITTVRGLSGKYDREAKRLIRNGVKWNVSTPENPEVSVILVY